MHILKAPWHLYEWEKLVRIKMIILPKMKIAIENLKANQGSNALEDFDGVFAC